MAPTAPKHVAIPKPLSAIKEELRSALDTADMSSSTSGENSDSDCFSDVRDVGGKREAWACMGPGACDIDVRDIRGGGALELRAGWSPARRCLRSTMKGTATAKPVPKTWRGQVRIDQWLVGSAYRGYWKPW